MRIAIILFVMFTNGCALLTTSSSELSLMIKDASIAASRAAVEQAFTNGSDTLSTIHMYVIEAVRKGSEQILISIDDKVNTFQIKANEAKKNGNYIQWLLYSIIAVAVGGLSYFAHKVLKSTAVPLEISVKKIDPVQSG